MKTTLEKSAITDLRLWIEGQMEIIQKRKDELRHRLIEAVPSCLNVWKNIYAAHIISNLFNDGFREVCFDSSDSNCYGFSCGFKDLCDLEDKLKELKKAWEEVVTIKIDWDGNSLRVFFKIV